MNTRKEEVVISSVRLLIRVGVIFAFYGILSVLPPLQKLTIPGVFFTPVDLLKVITFGSVAITLLYSRTELSKKFGALISEKVPLFDICSHAVVFFAIWSIYLGLREIKLFSNLTSLGENTWFLWGSVAAMSLPILHIALNLYNNSDHVSRFLMTIIKVHKIHDNGRHSTLTMTRTS